MSSVDVEILRLGIHGEGVGQCGGKTLFVEGALPGERVSASVYEERKTYARARLRRVLSPSEHRERPPCPLFGQCGGCQLMHLSYEQQLIMKRQRVVDALERIGKLQGISVLPCKASPTPLAYRNKIQLPVQSGPDGMRIGLYAHHTHDVVDVEACAIHCPLGERAYREVRRVLLDSAVIPYDPETGRGELRHILLRTALFSHQVLVVFVTAHDEPSSALLDAAEEIMHSMPQIRGIVQNVQSQSGNTVLGRSFYTLMGEGEIEERLCGLAFKVSPASFFQVNPPQAQQLYKEVLFLAECKGHETVLDAYCGVGTLALIFAEHVRRVIGVEIVPEAIRDAKENAHRNSISNAEFFCAPTEEFVQQIDPVDIVILNPPRTGCVPSALDALIKMRPPTILYVSCDPATLARDLAHLSQAGWQVDKVQPFDMFPQTAHVECAVRLKLPAALAAQQ
ncbi:MAG: 23S rRNA (uracil(1939)-C(5))-methyltransferase RlmD [Chlamydiia bacterium]